MPSTKTSRPVRGNSAIKKLSRSTQAIIALSPHPLAEILAVELLKAIAFVLPTDLSMEKSGEQE
jgi:hypothetical protein